MHKRRCHVTKNDRVVILAGLIANNAGIAPIRWRKPVPASIRDPGRETEEEALNSDHVNCIDSVDTVNISGGKATAR